MLYINATFWAKNKTLAGNILRELKKERREIIVLKLN